MMQERKRIVPLVVFSIILIIGASAFFLWKQSKFRLTGSTPAISGNVPTSTGTIQLNFNRDLKQEDYFKKVRDETGLVRGATMQKSTILLTLGPLDQGGNYVFDIGPITSVKGEVIDTIHVDFTATYVAYNKLSDEQRTLQEKQTDRGNIEDPVLALLPYQGDGFYLSSEQTANDNGDPILVIDAQLFLSIDDVQKPREEVTPVYEQRVTSFLRSKGLDPEKYYIRYTFNEPPVR